MQISQQVKLALQKSSAIRKMFEEGARLKAEYGAEQVHDFSLGNPCFEPPAAVRQAMRALVEAPPSLLHAYMPNAGHPSTRAALAAWLAQRDGLAVTAADVLMCVGAGGGLNVVLKAILNPDDEVITVAPYFVEYDFYVQNHGGRLIVCDSNTQFHLDLEHLAAALTPRTRAVLINSPNNPSGVVYHDDELQRLSALLKAHQAAHPEQTLYLLSDEPYRQLVYDDVQCSAIGNFYDNAIIVTSFSKDMGLAGERIGYIYVSPRCVVPDLRAALAFTTRTLGFVNAPSLMQKVAERAITAPIDVSFLARKRQAMAEILRAAGLKFNMPQGAFYFFPSVPRGDDEKFCEFLQKNYRILVVAGRTFGRRGHFRLSYSVPDRVITNSRQAWFEALKAW